MKPEELEYIQLVAEIDEDAQLLREKINRLTDDYELEDFVKYQGLNNVLCDFINDGL